MASKVGNALYRKERQKRKGKEQPMSLWDEISDIGEEFVEFLEKETGLSSAEVLLRALALQSLLFCKLRSHTCCMILA